MDPSDEPNAGARPDDPSSDLAHLPLAETVFDDDDAPLAGSRDRIVILGRRTSGKTVYLSVLYEQYWKSLNGLTMKALSGRVHTDCIRAVEGMRSGQWPAATLETQHCDLEIDYRGQRHLLVALDYAGELFRRAFVEDITDTPETKELVRHIDSAAAVMILIDPSVVVGTDVDAAIDDDFGMTQAVTRIRNWPGGKRIPVVLVLTKADENRDLVAADGGIERFVTKRFPGLARTLKRVAIFQVSAAPATIAADGRKIPQPDFKPWNIDKPLRFCLDQIDLQRELDREAEFTRQQRALAQRRIDEEARASRRNNRIIAAVVITMIVIAACAIALIWAFKS